MHKTSFFIIDFWFLTNAGIKLFFVLKMRMHI